MGSMSCGLLRTNFLANTTPEIEALPLETLVLQAGSVEPAADVVYLRLSMSIYHLSPVCSYLGCQVRAAGFEPVPFLALAPTPPQTLAVSEAEEELRLMGVTLVADFPIFIANIFRQ